MMTENETAEEINIDILLTFPHPCGNQKLVIGLDKLKEFQEDKAAFVAKQFGVTKDHYLRWVAYIRDPQCHAVTRQGRQCQNLIDLNGMATPDRFDPEDFYFCTTHAEHTEVTRVFTKGRRASQ